MQAADNPQAKSRLGITRRLRFRTRSTITAQHNSPVTLGTDICTHSMAGGRALTFLTTVTLTRIHTPSLPLSSLATHFPPLTRSIHISRVIRQHKRRLSQLKPVCHIVCCHRHHLQNQQTRQTHSIALRQQVVPPSPLIGLIHACERDIRRLR